MICRFITQIICSAEEEILTIDQCQACLLAHMSNQLNKLIKLLTYRPQRLNTQTSEHVR